ARTGGGLRLRGVHGDPAVAGLARPVSGCAGWNDDRHARHLGREYSSRGRRAGRWPRAGSPHHVRSRAEGPMSPERVFAIANLVAAAAWLLLAVLPRQRRARRRAPP